MRTLNTIIRYLVLIILYGSSYFAVVKALGLIFINVKVLIIFTLLTLIVYLTGRYFRSKRKEKFHADSLGSFVSYLFLSAALIFFLTGLVFSPIRIEWFDFTNSNPSYRLMVDHFSGIFLWVIILFVMIYPWRFVGKNRGLFTNVIIALFNVVGWIFLCYLVANNIFGFGEITGAMKVVGRYHEALAEKIYVPLLKLVVGSLPLGWFYELYIGTISPEKSQKPTV